MAALQSSLHSGFNETRLLVKLSEVSVGVGVGEVVWERKVQKKHVQVFFLPLKYS